MADAALSLNVELAAAAAATKGIRWLESLLCAVGLITASMSVASAIYKAPSGVFHGHGLAYYASVIFAGAAGLAEACAAIIWLSGVGLVVEAKRQLLVRRCVLCASVLPLAFMLGTGGVRLLVK